MTYVLALADDALVASQRMGWWISRAPQLEEDVALANIGLDQLGQARLLVFSCWQHELYAALGRSTDPTLAAIAGKAVKETAYHLDHAEHWVVRLGDGTDESHLRMQAALDAEWPWRGELFDTGFLDPRLVEQGIAVDPAALRGPVERRIAAVADEATLTLPDTPEAISRGRQGLHTEAMGFLLAEMQHLARSHPGVTW